MNVYEELLERLGLTHLKDDPDKLQEVILKELGMSELKGDNEAQMERSQEMLDKRQQEFEKLRTELGEMIQKDHLKRGN